MAGSISFQVLGTDTVVASLGKIPDSTKARLRPTIMSLIERVAQIAKQRVGNGPLGKSIDVDFTETDSEMTGYAFSEGIPYARIQEYGGVTRPHDILPVNAKALAFFSPGKMPISKTGGQDLVIVRKVHHPGSRIPEMAYMRGGLAKMRAIAIAEITAAVRAGAKQAVGQ